MGNSITLTSDAWDGRVFKFTVIQSGTSSTVNWTFEVTQMNSGTLATVSPINCTIDGHSVYSHPQADWDYYGSMGNTFPVYYGSTSGSYDIGSYGTFSVVLSGRPGYSTATTKSGSITLTQPAPTINTISVRDIPDFISGYDGDSFMLTCNPSGGTGYTYKWYRGATNIGTSQNLTGTLSNSTYDNTSVYCIVTDSTGGTATTNRCEFRVGTSASQTQVSTKQIEPVRIYSGSKFLYGIPLLYNSGWKYSSWNTTYTSNNRANIAVVGKAIVG